MQTTYTSVLARRIRIDGDFATLPYEAGWATEAVFFVQTEGEHPNMEIAVEVSPTASTGSAAAARSTWASTTRSRRSRSRPSATGCESLFAGRHRRRALEFSST